MSCWPICSPPAPSAAWTPTPRLLRRVLPQAAPARTRRQLAVDLVADLRILDRRITAVEERLRHAVTQSATRLVELFGSAPFWPPSS
jgi:hypothetical protein